MLTTFAGVQDNRDMGIGVFGIDTSTNFGKNFADACMEIIKNTNADNYSQYNITRIVTKAVWKLCYQRNVSTMNFSILNEQAIVLYSFSLMSSVSYIYLSLFKI